MTCNRFSLGTPVSSTNKTDLHDIIITDILLKVVVNTINLTYKHNDCWVFFRYAASVGAKHFHTSAKLSKGIDEMFLDLSKGK
jgi:Ras-related protein Rab-21